MNAIYLFVLWLLIRKQMWLELHDNWVFSSSPKLSRSCRLCDIEFHPSNNRDAWMGWVDFTEITSLTMFCLTSGYIPLQKYLLKFFLSLLKNFSNGSVMREKLICLWNERIFLWKKCVCVCVCVCVCGSYKSIKWHVLRVKDGYNTRVITTANICFYILENNLTYSISFILKNLVKLILSSFYR